MPINTDGEKHRSFLALLFAAGYGAVIQQVWKAKDAIAAKHNHDMRFLVEHSREKERTSPSSVVDLHAGRDADSRTK